MKSTGTNLEDDTGNRGESIRSGATAQVELIKSLAKGKLSTLEVARNQTSGIETTLLNDLGRQDRTPAGEARWLSFAERMLQMWVPYLQETGAIQQVRPCWDRDCRRPMKIIHFIFFLVLALPACRQTGNAPVRTAEYGVEPSGPSEADNWQRTKDCSARMDAMKDENPTPGLQHGRVAHYSRKYGRCFVKITDTMTAKARNGERQTSVMLMDAFEGSIGAMLPLLGPCYLGGKQEDCAKAEAFISDAMAN